MRMLTFLFALLFFAGFLLAFGFRLIYQNRADLFTLYRRQRELLFRRNAESSAQKDDDDDDTTVNHMLGLLSEHEDKYE
ncbi:MAG: hypothetical protein KDD94_09965 [Calditrichaeota bacterium]|nr:hypothetical protein [Calditrichota bacterium]